MTSRVTYLADIQVVETVYDGDLPPAALAALVKETIEKASEFQAAKFLADCRSMKMGHSVFDLYYLASLVESSVLNRSEFREAVLYPTDLLAGENVRFWETTALNRGLTVKIFTDRETSLQWLAGEKG